MEEDLNKITNLLQDIKKDAMNYIDSIGVLILSLDTEGRVVFLNKMGCELLGYTEDEVIGLSWFNTFIPAEGRTALMKMFSDLISGSKQGYCESQVITRNGNKRYFKWNSSLLKHENGDVSGLICAGEDITDKQRTEDALRRSREEQKTLERQLIQAQKMEAVGHLTGGLAHDFNNLLTAIVGHATLLQAKFNSNTDINQHVQHILKTCDRAASLIYGLLAFSKKQILFKKSVELNHIIRDIEKLIARLIGEDIEVKMHLSDKDIYILADTGQIEQVLMNLATNARDAMPSGGEMTIFTKLVDLDTDFIQSFGYGKPGVYALLSVTDKGKGMDAVTVSKIFDPFFSTKPDGKGTGLGLSIIYGIIKQHDGYINVYSCPGEGTTFNIYFPVIRTKAEKPGVQKVVPARRGAETILLAEDEPDVRDVIKTLLESFGYKVIEAVDGEDAISRFKENEEYINLLVFDLLMPHKNGKEAYDEIKKINSDVRIVYISGYSDDIIRRSIFEEGFDFISKPLKPNDFLRKIRDVLDREAAVPGKRVHSAI
ncbi:MAG: PAS domain S-box protein [Nitrospirae bacterium]|nr:PAS domain S-box protein [Nitrospirota bacterium]